MENFNKIISFVLGLIVVVVFLAVISRKVDFKKILPFSKEASKTTISPTPKPQQTIVIENDTYTTATDAQTGKSYQTQQAPSTTTIPSTGAPTLFFPAALSLLFAGLKLKKIK